MINSPAAAIVRPAEDPLALLAQAINAEHDLGLAAERKSLEHYRRAGEYLLQAERQVAAAHGGSSHNHWLRWQQDHLTFSNQRVSEYTRLARGWDKLPPGGDFTLKGALAHLAEQARANGPGRRPRL